MPCMHYTGAKWDKPYTMESICQRNLCPHASFLLFRLQQQQQQPGSRRFAHNNQPYTAGAKKEKDQENSRGCDVRMLAACRTARDWANAHNKLEQQRSRLAFMLFAVKFLIVTNISYLFL